MHKGLKQLDGVDRFEPYGGGGEVDQDEETAGQLITASGDGMVDPKVAELALDLPLRPPSGGRRAVVRERQSGSEAYW